MSSTSAGLILIGITILIVIAMIVCNKGIRKVTNCYFFGLALGLFGLIGLIIFRFAPDGVACATHGPFDDPGSEAQSRIISKAFLLDACPFAGLGICVLLIADPSRKIARAFSPIALMGGAITLLSFGFDSSLGTELSAQFIFIGDGYNRCYFIMHFLQVVLSVGILLNTPRFGGKGYLSTLGIAIAYYGYVAIVMAISGCRGYCSGLSLNDGGPFGEYHFVAELLGCPVGVTPIIGFPFLYVMTSLGIILKDYIFSKGHGKYGNAHSHKGYLGYNYNKYVVQKIL